MSLPSNSDKLMVPGLKQLKLAAGILAGLAKAGHQTGIATAIDLALKATDFGDKLRKQDPVAAALRDVSAKLEEATRKALSGEFGTDWESRPDLAATLAALPDVLESYAPDTDAIFAVNLDPERMARRATDAAEAAHDDLFRRNTVGERLLFAVVRQTYAVALANKDFALQMILRGQGETLNRLDEAAARIRGLHELLSGNHPAARALQEVRDTLRPDVPDIQRITDEHLPGIVRRILEDARKPGADPADFSGAVRRALEQAREHRTNLEFVTAARVLDAQLAQIDAEDRDRAREHAALLSERGRVAALQLRYPDAAAFHKKAAALMAFDERAAWGHTMDAAGVLSDHGREFGDNQALHDAIAVYRTALDLASRERVPLDWAGTQNNLGNALRMLGERESGTARLEEAVTACRDALKEYTRERVPLNWATAQNNLGTALLALTSRGDDRAVYQAIDAYRDALLECSRKRAPYIWAMVQNNLGNALVVLGERGDNDALRQAVVCFQAALLEHTRERTPLAWAMAQNNLGNALRLLGQRGDNNALRLAVGYYQGALLGFSRDRVPLDWANIQHNLGGVLRMLGELGDDDASLLAVVACKAALLERTQDRTPLDWAMTKVALGDALRVLGERGDYHALYEAIDAYRDALREYTRECAPLAWATVQNNLGNALRALGECGDDDALGCAIDAFKAALLERRRDRVPLDWAMTKTISALRLGCLVSVAMTTPCGYPLTPTRRRCWNALGIVRRSTGR